MNKNGSCKKSFTAFHVRIATLVPKKIVMLFIHSIYLQAFMFFDEISQWGTNALMRSNLNPENNYKVEPHSTDVILYLSENRK